MRNCLSYELILMDDLNKVKLVSVVSTGFYVLSSRKDSSLMDFIGRDRGIEIHDNKLSVGLYDELLDKKKKNFITVKTDAQVYTL